MIMKKMILILIVCFNTSMVRAATIATGPSDGSYFQIAQDIKNVAGKDGIDIQVTPTKGSVENIELLSAGKTDLAIIQLDALRFVSDVLKQKQGLDLFDNIKIIMNLYPEEIHVLSNNKEIQSFYQLEGKRISVGTEGGGTAITAAVLLVFYDIKATVSFETFDDAMKKLGKALSMLSCLSEERRSPLLASWTAKFIWFACRPIPHLSKSIHERCWENPSTVGQRQKPKRMRYRPRLWGWTSGTQTTRRRCKIWFWPS